MHFWMTFLHIVALTIWFAGLFFLPRLLIAHNTASDLGKVLYFGVMTPAAAATILLGIVLLAWGFEGAWLVAKLVLVALIVLLHVYLGRLLLEPSVRAPLIFYRILNWVPLFLLLAIVALAAAKPWALPPLGGV